MDLLHQGCDGTVAVVVHSLKTLHEVLLGLPEFFEFLDDFDDELVELELEIVLVDGELEEEGLFVHAVKQQTEDVLQRHGNAALLV